jgi:hypothetical protein
MEPKSNLNLYLTIIGSTIAVISITLALKQYIEGRELRTMQKELTALQLVKARKEYEQV